MKQEKASSGQKPSTPTAVGRKARTSTGFSGNRTAALRRDMVEREVFHLPFEHGYSDLSPMEAHHVEAGDSRPQRHDGRFFDHESLSSWLTDWRAS